MCRYRPGVAPPKDWVRLHASLPPDLHRRARASASLDGVTLQDLIVAAVQAHVERREAERAGDRKRRGG